MLKKTASCGIVLVIIASIAGLAWAWHPAIAPVSPPEAADFSEDSIARGAIIAASGYCAECHTRTASPKKNGLPAGAVFAGDFEMDTKFGTLFSSNITPDPKTGIGTWSEDAFRRAMREGISRDGRNLFPAFPYDHFTKMTDNDIDDLYAYLMTRPAVNQTVRQNTMPFPLNLRLLQAGWKLLFFRSGVYRPDPKHDILWNRGAYLAEGAAHCSSCHTPRNLLGAEKQGNLYDGAEIDGWIAPPLNASNPAPTTWTEDELYAYLRTGSAPLHGVTAGPMAPVIHSFLSQLPDTDLRAVAHYFASKTDHPDSTAKNSEARARAMQVSGLGISGTFDGDEDARLYQRACAACHVNSGTIPANGRPELSLSSALWLDEPDNLFMVMLGGVRADEGQKGLVMPSFATALTNQDMARIAAWLRRTRTTRPPWTDLEKKAQQAREQLGSPPVYAPVVHTPPENGMKTSSGRMNAPNGEGL